MNGKLKVVCISDTHNYHNKINLPSGDILIHAGDLTGKGSANEIEEFNNWLGAIKYKYRYIVIIAGNHDHLFEKDETNARQLITHAIYLQDEIIEIEGRKIYGTPWQPAFLKWAFNLERDGEDLKQKWGKIPFNLDILISHCPPKGICDTLKRETIVDDPSGRPLITKLIDHMGCEALYHAVILKKPKNHVFGHIHDGYGTFQSSDTLFMNAAICNEEYEAINEPIIFYI